MSADILTPSNIGFFGKLPTSGDFVSRGVIVGLRRFWDGWISRHILLEIGEYAAWPETGLKIIGQSPVAGFAAVVWPSRDKAMRVFPLSFLASFESNLPDAISVEGWAQSLAPIARLATQSAVLPAELDAQLKALPAPRFVTQQQSTAEFAIWSDIENTVSCDPLCPSPAVKAIFSA